MRDGFDSETSSSWDLDEDKDLGGDTESIEPVNGGEAYRPHQKGSPLIYWQAEL